MDKHRKIRGKSKNKKKARQRKARLLVGAWILSMALVTAIIYWFVAGKEQYASTCYSDGEAAMMVGIYPQANRYFAKAIRYTNAPITLSTQIKRLYLAHLRSLEDRGDYPKADRVSHFILDLFPRDEDIRRTVEELSILLAPSEDLQLRTSKIYPGVNGHFLRNGDLLLQDFRERYWLLDTEKNTTRRVFPLRDEIFLAASPSGRYAAVILSPSAEKRKPRKGLLGFLDPDGQTITKTNLTVAADSACSWSPDDTTVVIDALSPTGETFICLVDATSGETKQFKDVGSHPSWSPLGNSIAFLKGADSSCSLAINSIQGDTTQTLAPLRKIQGAPCWSPKEDALLVQAPSQILAFDPKGKPLFTLRGPLSFPSWAPTGGLLAAVEPGKKEITLLNRKGVPAKIPTGFPATACEWAAEGSKLVLNYDDGKDRFLNLVTLGRKSPPTRPQTSK